MSIYYIAHHGIKGQRWGIRRYQNDDGTLTEKGKKHYGSDITKVKKRDLDYQMNNYRYSKNPNTSKRSSAVLSKRNEEVSTSEEANKANKSFHELDKAYDDQTKVESDYAKDSSKKNLDRLNKAEQRSIEKEAEYAEAIDAYQTKFDKVTEKYADEYRGAVLKDMGYEDTQAGRDFIKKNYNVDL